jgi:regulatory protein
VSPGRGPPKPLAPERAWDYALWLLGRQAYTTAEVRERLRRRSLPEPDAERVVARLLELGLLDDRAYAENYVERRTATRGRLALQSELRRKGVAQPLIEAALAAESDEGQGRAAAALLRKQAWRFEAATGGDATAAAKARAKAYALLARRGFPPDAVRAAIDDVLPAIDDDRAD